MVCIAYNTILSFNKETMSRQSEYIQTNIIDRFSDSGRYFRGEYNGDALLSIEETRKEFPFFSNVTYKYYQPKPLQRYLLIGDQFKDYLDEKILDVGSRDNTLKNVLKKDCFLVDKNNPNLPPFDWEKEDLPFTDNSFDSVVCLDTLEHINDIHKGLHDLLRVSKRYVIISLPNCWRKTIKQFVKGYGTSASYGLPPEKPHDRHKWFFNTEDIENFIFYNASLAKLPFGVKTIAYHIPLTISRHRIIYPLARLLLPERYFKNFFVNTVFICLEKV